MRTLLVGALLVAPLAMAGAGADGDGWVFRGVQFAPCRDWESWYTELWNAHGAGAVVPLKFEPTDDDLARMNLPPRHVLASMRFPLPTMVDKDGNAESVPLELLEQAVAQPQSHNGPTVASFAGTGCLGIRPGSLLLLLTGGSIGWCSMAHVYGAPGTFKISTAGHCGKTGDTATVVAALGNRVSTILGQQINNPILLDFGRFSASHDNGIGDDWALIDINAEFQGLVSPTMCFWGGPRGVFTTTGAVASVTLQWNWNRFPFVRGTPSLTTSANPTLVQGIVHYGHGTAVGTGGTPRIAAGVHWWPTYFQFYGAISPGDSGSGANVVTGDAVGNSMEAAGIMTHIVLVDPPEIAKNIGALTGGTRATQVSATLANGQIVPYPAPAPGLP